MRKSKRESYTQSDNAQAVVDAGESRLGVGQRVSDCASDAGQLEPDLQSVSKAGRLVCARQGGVPPRGPGSSFRMLGLRWNAALPGGVGA
jgi:hypothetical protein